MDKQTEILNIMKNLCQSYFENQKREPFIYGKTKIDLAVPTYGAAESYDAIESIMTQWVTMGKKVSRFEQMFAEYIGVKHAIMVNSGSSANLLAISVLTNHSLNYKGIEPGAEVITPAVTWVTTVYPIIQCGATPVLVDVDLFTLNALPETIEEAITERTRAVMLVNLCGNPCELDRIREVVNRHNLYLIEDNCESVGASYCGKKAGAFGDISTASFFFTHIISTIEGGMVCTDNDEFARVARSLRVFGWIREAEDKERLSRTYPGIDPLFLFTNIGFNLRPTEIQGAFGIHQLPKLEGFIRSRQENAEYWNRELGRYSKYLLLYSQREGARHVWHHYPVTVRPEAPFTRDELVKHLNSRGVETRPIMTGNMDEQPVMRLFRYRKHGELPNARLIHRNSLLFGCHHGIGKAEREAVAGYFHEFMLAHGVV